MPEPFDLLAMLVFSMIGLVAFRSAIRELQYVRIGISLVLMLYPYLVTGIWLWAVGILLTAGLFFFKD